MQSNKPPRGNDIPQVQHTKNTLINTFSLQNLIFLLLKKKKKKTHKIEASTLLHFLSLSSILLSKYYMSLLTRTSFLPGDPQLEVTSLSCFSLYKHSPSTNQFPLHSNL